MSADNPLPSEDSKHPKCAQPKPRSITTINTILLPSLNKNRSTVYYNVYLSH